jgi:hypothetical protein
VSKAAAPVDVPKRVPTALHIQAHGVYDPVAAVQGCGDLSLAVDIGFDGVRSGLTRFED